jgi:hypothetical protein
VIKLQRLSFCAILMMWSLGAESSSDDFDQLAVSLQQTDRVQTAIAHVLTLEPQSQSDLIELNEIPAPPFQEDASPRHCG